MNPLLVAMVILADSPAIRFERHEIDKFPAGYQVAVADINGDGRPDVIALSTEANRVDWYENPTWKRRPVARVERPIDLAVHDLDGDGKPEIALASGFYFNDASRGGQIQWLKPRALTPASEKGDRSNLCEAPEGPFRQIGPVPFFRLALTPDPSPKGRGELLSDGRLDEPWEIHPIAVDPVTHRLRWADLDGDGKKELVHAPIFGPGSKANIDPKPSHLWAFRVPKDPVKDPWPVWKIDETLTVLHGLCVVSSRTRIGTEPSPPAPLPKGAGNWPSPPAPLPKGEEISPSPPTPLPKGEGSYWRRDGLLTASYEGIFSFYAEGAEEEKGDRSNLCEAPGGRAPAEGWSRQIGPVPFFGATLRLRKEQISAGEKPADQKPGASRGSSEVAYGRLSQERPFVAAIEPWHGNEVVVYLTSFGKQGTLTPCPSPKGRGELVLTPGPSPGTGEGSD